MKKIQIIAMLIVFTGICQAQTASIEPNSLPTLEGSSTENRKHIKEVSEYKRIAVLRIRHLLTQKMEYPQLAKDDCIEGSLTLEVSVANNGKIQDFKILESSHAELDRAVLNTMRQLKGLQIIEKHRAGMLKVQTPINFRLN